MQILNLIVVWTARLNDQYSKMTTRPRPAVVPHPLGRFFSPPTLNLAHLNILFGKNHLGHSISLCLQAITETPFTQKAYSETLGSNKWPFFVVTLWKKMPQKEFSKRFLRKNYLRSSISSRPHKADVRTQLNDLCREALTAQGVF